MKEQLNNQSLAVLARLSNYCGEPDWLWQIRKKAFNALDKVATPKIERTDYTNWNLWDVEESLMKYEHYLSRADENKESKSRLRAPYLQHDTGLDTEIERYNEISRNDGVIICSYREAVRNYPDLFKEAHQASFTKPKDLFFAFNMAFLKSGLFIYIPENTEVEEAIEIAFEQNNTFNNLTSHQVLIYADKNSKSEIIERYFSGSNSIKTEVNLNIQVIAKEGAQLRYSTIDHFGKNTKGYISRQGILEKDSLVNWALGMMNDGNMIEDVYVDIKGNGASSSVKAVSISQGDKVQVSNIKITNSGSNTSGNIFQHGVALEKSTLTFNAIGHILNGAKNSDAQQESRALMLSDEARADANPILLIDEYEVTAGHAASVSRVDEEDLYYLQSRGIDKVQAEKMIIHGFLSIVLSDISVKEVREELIKTIERKLKAL